MKRWRFKVRIFLCACLALAALTSCARSEKKGTLRVRVTDGWTDAPIANARVVIPECGVVADTDAAGETDRIEIPIRGDEHFLHILPQDWGTVTVLVYAEGYYSLALFHAHVTEDQARDPLPLSLFPNDGSLKTPFSLVESPEPVWVEELLHRYGP